MRPKSIKLKLDFERNSTSPERVFDAMSDLIQSTQSLHSCVLSSIVSDFETQLLLSDVETGSIISWLTPKITSKEESLPQEKVAKITHLLNISTQRIIQFIEGKETISSSSEIDELEEGLRNDSVDLEEFPNVFSLDRHRLMKGLSSIGKATEKLHEDDTVYIELHNGTFPINKNFNFSDNEVKKLLLEKTEEVSGEKTFIIKKADFLGNSMWDFILGGKTIQAKMRDQNWIDKFHHRKEVVYPGDALRCKYKLLVSYDRQGKVIEKNMKYWRYYIK
ncbi:MAG TPA: hypothetical protein ENK73_01205 [Thiomicrospira sp.]|nr:hypothetical protein [Thiomicrospira sp.]